MILCIEKNQHLAQMYKFKLEKMFNTNVNISKTVPANLSEIRKSSVILMLNSLSKIERKYIRDNSSTSTEVLDMRAMSNPLPFLDFKHISEKIGDRFFYTRRQKPFSKIPITILDMFKGSPPFPVYYKHNFSYLQEIVKGDYFYIKNEDYDTFTKLYIARFQNKIDTLMKVKEQLQLLTAVKDRAFEVGIENSTIQIVDKIYIGIINNTDNPNIREFYKKQDYLSEHSLFLSYLLIDNLSELGLTADGKILALSSLFHDFFMENRDETYNDSEVNSLNRSMRINKQIINIIRNHQKSAMTDYISAVFNIFHDYAHYRYRNSHEQSMCRLRTRYPNHLNIITKLVSYN